MLKQRLFYGAIMIAAMVLIFYFDDQLDHLLVSDEKLQSLLGKDHLPRGLLLLAVFMGLMVPASAELCAIFRAENIDADRIMVTAAGMLGCFMLYAIPEDLSSRNTMAVLASLIIVLFLVTLLKYSWLHKRTDGAVAVAAVVAFALIYMGLLPGFLITIRRWYSAWVVLGIILITKSCDIGAFFTGRAIGRHKLIEWLSPKKTWEGLCGGVLAAALTAMLLAHLNNKLGIGVWTFVPGGEPKSIRHDFDPFLSFWAGALIGLCGQFGDLVASLFKRDAGIKDSGTSIPGFGGMLDVLDSPIVVAPLAYWMLTFGGSMH